MAKHGRIGKFTALPGQRDALAALMVEAANLVETADEGNDVYLICTSEAEPDAVWVMEVWDTKEAADAALKSEAVRALIPRVLALVDRDAPSEARHLEVLGGKGMR